MYTSIDSLYSLYLQCRSVVIDSRKATQGDLFFALQGENTNGNAYAEKALQSGAIGAIVDDPELADVPGCYMVQDVLTTLQGLAKKHRGTFEFPVIGLTGSNGKTTTKELIHAVLSAQYKVEATKGNLNNHIGVPLTLLSVKNQPDFLIVEMGANHQGEIAFLCELCRPDFGLITNVGKAHLEGFRGFEGVKKGKSELYGFINAHHGKLFVNAEDKELMSLLPDIPRENIRYYYPSRFTSEGQKASLEFIYSGNRYLTNLTGTYNLPNIAAAIEIGEYFNVDKNSIAKALVSYIPNNNRSQKMEFMGLHLFLDAYNANPTSMRASIHNFINLDAKDKVLILGDMFELGAYSTDEHRALIEWLSHFEWKQVILIGKHFSSCQSPHKNFVYCLSAEEAKPMFESLFRSGASVLLKGSRGIALEKLWQ